MIRWRNRPIKMQPKPPSFDRDATPEPGKGRASVHDREASQARAEVIERLFREHNESLLQFLTTRLRSSQDAHEVAQEAYVRLLSLDQPGAVSYLRAFLFKTAANLAVDRMRRNGVRSRTTVSLLFNEFVDGRTPERELAGNQVMERMARLVEALPEHCQRAFVLSRVGGRTFAEIAQDLKVSESSARAYVVRALLYCRARLDEEMQG